MILVPPMPGLAATGFPNGFESCEAALVLVAIFHIPSAVLPFVAFSCNNAVWSIRSCACELRIVPVVVLNWIAPWCPCCLPLSLPLLAAVV